MKINDQELTEEQTNKLKKCLPELFSSKYRPNVGDRVWTLSDISYIWQNSLGDKRRLASGNIFLTPTEYEKELEYRKALTTIKHYILDNFGEWKPDWEDEGQRKYFIYYDHKHKQLGYNWSYFFQEIMPSFLYLQSDGQCEQLIEACETELKIVCGVK